MAPFPPWPSLCAFAGIDSVVLQSKKIDVSNIRLFILDEADKLTDPDNLDIIMKVFNRIPKV